MRSMQGSRQREQLGTGACRWSRGKDFFLLRAPRQRSGTEWKAQEQSTRQGVAAWLCLLRPLLLSFLFVSTSCFEDPDFPAGYLQSTGRWLCFSRSSRFVLLGVLSFWKGGNQNKKPAARFA